MQNAVSLIGGGAASLGATATTVAGLESLVLINKHVFVPAMEYTTKAVWGVFGQDPLRTEQELHYARKTYIEPVFDFVEGINVALKNQIETTLGVDLDRDGGVGAIQKIQNNGDKGAGMEEGKGEKIDLETSVPIQDKTHKGRGSGTAKISDSTPEQTAGIYSQPYDSIKTRIQTNPGFDENLYNSLIGLNKEA